MKNENFLKRVGFSLKGLKSAWKTEKSFRSQVIVAFFVIVLLITLKPAPIWAAIFAIIIGATIAAELMNTALEYMLDVLHPGLHPGIGRAKDCAAAAVLILSIASVVIFSAFLYERLT